MNHPDIVDAAVIGIDYPTEGLQRVRAYLVRRPGTNPSEKAICDWMKLESASTAHLTAGAEFLEELPRNEVGQLIWGRKHIIIANVLNSQGNF